MTTITREQLSNILHTGKCLVKFTKIDGDVRAMPCTLNAELIPPAVVKVLAEGEISKVKKENPDVMSVWCLDKNEWRSFRVANVISATIQTESIVDN